MEENEVTESSFSLSVGGCSQYFFETLLPWKIFGWERWCAFFLRLSLLSSKQFHPNVTYFRAYLYITLYSLITLTLKILTHESWEGVTVIFFPCWLFPENKWHTYLLLMLPPFYSFLTYIFLCHILRALVTICIITPYQRYWYIASISKRCILFNNDDDVRYFWS